jgi:purine-nucleoside phosphorylase
MFNPQKYLARVEDLARFVQSKYRVDFEPSIALTLGSGGAGEFARELKIIAEIPYSQLPEFFQTTVPGHSGKLLLSRVGKTDLIVFSGRKHFYELGYSGDIYTNLKEVVLPVYLAAALGCKLYIATNAAGGLNSKFALGDLMLVSSHFDLFFPNVLAGPEMGIPGSLRFQPQNQEYSPALRQQILEIGKELGIGAQIHQGVYAAVTGPTYESQADSLGLRHLGVDAVGMSTVPEVITAANLGLATLGFSLITNVIGKDGTNATSHQEVQSALDNPEIKNRFFKLLKRFLDVYSEIR